MRTGWGLVAAIVFVGCSGAPSSDLFATTDQEGTTPAATNTGAPSGSSTSSSPGDSSPSGGSGDGSGNGSANDAGSTNPTDAGVASSDASTGSSLPACTPAEMEVEPNDSFVSPNAMTDSKFCGEINPATDLDFATFVLSKTAKSVSVDYDATDKISIQVTTKGQTVQIVGTNPPPIPTNPGEEYYIEVSGVSGSMPAYVITVKQN